MKRMSIAREIKIQKLQNKNRMVGQTFNPGGHTAASLDQRERDEIKRIEAMTDSERQQHGQRIKDWERYKDENNIYCSNSFEDNVFLRNFHHH